MFSLSPKDDRFFDYFIKYGEIAYEAAEMLKALTSNVKDAESKFKEIEVKEHEGDKQLHDIMEALNKTFITPLDREDIYAISKALDDIVDDIEAVASRYVLFNVTNPSDYAIVLSDLITQSCKEIIKLMTALKSMKNTQNLSKSIIEINRLENQGDSDFRVAVRSLFTSDVPTIEVIKWREIYELYEHTLDSCEDVANIVEGVVMKHA
jgi:predicted phosphate transport protein (TIGR00153 family)